MSAVSDDIRSARIAGTDGVLHHCPDSSASGDGRDGVAPPLGNRPIVAQPFDRSSSVSSSAGSACSRRRRRLQRALVSPHACSVRTTMMPRWRSLGGPCTWANGIYGSVVIAATFGAAASLAYATTADARWPSQPMGIGRRRCACSVASVAVLVDRFDVPSGVHGRSNRNVILLGHRFSAAGRAGTLRRQGRTPGARGRIPAQDADLVRDSPRRCRARFGRGFRSSPDGARW